MASKRSIVWDYIQNAEKDADGWVMKTGREIADSLRMEPKDVFQIIGSLKHYGRIATRKEGHTVVGVRPLDAGEKPEVGQEPSTVVNFARVTGRLNTPETDKYMAARQRLADLRRDPTISKFLSESPEMQAEPIYAEAALLKDALVELQQKLDRTQSLLREEKAARQAESRELEYLRKINNKEVRKALESAGVVHGD